MAARRRWHEVLVKRYRDPVVGRDLLLVIQTDVTAKVGAGRTADPRVTPSSLGSAVASRWAMKPCTTAASWIRQGCCTASHHVLQLVACVLPSTLTPACHSCCVASARGRWTLSGGWLGCWRRSRPSWTSAFPDTVGITPTHRVINPHAMARAVQDIKKTLPGVCLLLRSPSMFVSQKCGRVVQV